MCICHDLERNLPKSQAVDWNLRVISTQFWITVGCIAYFWTLKIISSGTPGIWRRICTDSGSGLGWGGRSGSILVSMPSSMRLATCSSTLSRSSSEGLKPVINLHLHLNVKIFQELIHLKVVPSCKAIWKLWKCQFLGSFHMQNIEKIKEAGNYKMSLYWI